MSDEPTRPGDAAALLADMERLGTRKYSEVGVPMFLVAENLREDAPAASAPAEWLAVAEEFEDHAELLKARDNGVELRDVARLIEVFADRHIAPGTVARFTALSDAVPLESDRR